MLNPTIASRALSTSARKLNYQTLVGGRPVLETLEIFVPKNHVNVRETFNQVSIGLLKGDPARSTIFLIFQNFVKSIKAIKCVSRLKEFEKVKNEKDGDFYMKQPLLKVVQDLPLRYIILNH